jgi:hypothetical protein
MTEDEINQIAIRLDSREQFVLLWMVKEVRSRYGECSGQTLDDLIAKGLAMVQEINDRCRKHWPAHPTELGLLVAQRLQNRIARHDAR